ncbi:substance-K receptor-like [Crassostrea angulata]|uniref:substance-K receptor-like n=1 Tax=Magallana angulata TaxID=2784310 RepID=UPI0022B11F80|nr:substance-K receptor-like [Crassostrea angulata]
MKTGALSSKNDTFSLEKWNSYYSKLYLPNTVLLTIWLIIGTLGNATVIFVYQKGLKNKGHGRFFIPILATVDLMCVSVSATFNIVQITGRVTFPDSWICKMFFYSIRVILTHSMLIMTVIAISRFQHICHIIKYQIKTFHLWIAIAGTGIFSMLSYIPTFFAFGTVEVYKENITGYKCKEIDNDAIALDKGSLYFMAVVHGTSILLIIISYFSIAVFIFKAYCRRRRHTMNINTIESENGGNGLTMRSGPKNKQMKTPLWSYRFTLMFFTLQVCMLVGYIPHVIAIKKEEADPNFWDRKSDDISKNVHLAMRLLYFTNAVINPFLYGFFDPAFRRKLVYLICNRKRTGFA